MSLYNVFDIAGTGMSAQSIRLNTVASNVANVNSISSSINETYKAREPIFSSSLVLGPTVNKYKNDYKINDYSDMKSLNGSFAGDLLSSRSGVGVKVRGIVEKKNPVLQEYNPNHPLANKDGYIYRPNVNVMEEMANMVSASNSYQMNISVATIAKSMLNKTLTLGQA